MLESFAKESQSYHNNWVMFEAQKIVPMIISTVSPYILTVTTLIPQKTTDSTSYMYLATLPKKKNKPTLQIPYTVVLADRYLWVYIFIFTRCKNNQFQKKSIRLNTIDLHIYLQNFNKNYQTF